MQVCKKITAAVFLFFFLLVASFCYHANAAVISAEHIEDAAAGKFVKQGNYWTYQYTDGTIARHCLLNINGKTYLFSSKGYRQYGWKKIEEDYYYFGTASQGYMYRKCWVKQDRTHYYFVRSSGKRAVGWIKSGGKRYYCASDGVRWYGWHKINNKKYFFGMPNEGWMYQNSLVTYKDHVYYLTSSGAMGFGWQKVDGYDYYFDTNGQAFTGKHRIDDVMQYFDAKGRLQYSGINLHVTSASALLLEADTGNVIFSKSADTQRANASTTKIMTCILALENSKLSDKVTASANAAAQEPTKLYMSAGESFRMKDLLYSLMIPSHNDTAVAIAEHISSTTTKFVSLMNQKAAAMGCTNTHFATPNGLDAGLNHYTTANDLAKIARYALKYDTFRSIIKTASYSFTSYSGKKYSFTTTNELLNSYTGLCGLKTGYTNKAGHCFVGLFNASNGKQYISITLGAATSADRWNDTKILLNYANQLA